MLNLHHRPETIAAVVGDGNDLGARVRYSWEQPAVLGSAGGPRLALSIVGADTFFLINGDTLTNVDLGALGRACIVRRARHAGARAQRDPHATVACSSTASGRVIGFAGAGAAEGSYHFIGVQIAQRSRLRSSAPGAPAELDRRRLRRAYRRQPGAVRGFVCDADFWDVGTVCGLLVNVVAFMEARRDAGSV